MKFFVLIITIFISFKSFAVEVEEYNIFMDKKSSKIKTETIEYDDSDTESSSENNIQNDENSLSLEIENNKEKLESETIENEIKNDKNLTDLDLSYRVAEWLISTKEKDTNTLFYNLLDKNLVSEIIKIDSVQKKLTYDIKNISKRLMQKLKIDENLSYIENKDFIYSCIKPNKEKIKSEIFKNLIKSGYFIKKNKVDELDLENIDIGIKKQLTMQAFYYEKLDLIKKIKYHNKQDKELNKFIDSNYNFYRKIHDRKGRIKINKSIIDQYINKNEYTDLMIAKHNKKDNYLSYKIISNRDSFDLDNQEWFKITLLNISHMLDLKINEKYYVAHKLLSKINPNLLTLDQYHRQQWMLGYMSIKLEKYKDAITYFEAYKNSTIFAANRARALYWISIVYEYMMDKERSISYKKEAAKYPFSFYGQNAIEDLIYHDEFENNLSLVSYIKKKIKEIDEIFKDESHEIPNNIFFLTGLILYDRGFSGYANDFFMQFIKSPSIDDKEKIIGLSIVKKRTSEVFYKILSIYASKFNIINNDQTSFPIFEELNNNTLVHALVKQETGFSKNAISSKNARGLMQIIPQTAKIIAKTLKIKYDKYRLVVDEAYNLTIGRKYLADLLEKFNGNKILALGAYNAGPGAVQRWIDRFGDLRKVEDSDVIVDWIENIPFMETKHYIMKITENEMIYRALIEDNVQTK